MSTYNLNKITNAEFTIQEGIVIEFITNDTIGLKSKWLVNFENSEHCFESIKVKTHNGLLLIQAKEVDYWADAFNNLKNFDLRDLIGINVEKYNK